jgi:hypothetical protein
MKCDGFVCICRALARLSGDEYEAELLVDTLGMVEGGGGLLKQLIVPCN